MSDEDMLKDEFSELHYITPIFNVESILRFGILCNKEAAKLPHHSIADDEIQERRQDKRLPNGLTIHRCANVYFYARNAMMYRRQALHRSICVLRINPSVLDIDRVLVSDRNASRDLVRFGTPDEMIPLLKFTDIFRKSWDVGDEAERYRLKGTMCAEVLVPNRIDPCYIMGAYASCAESLAELLRMAPALDVRVNPDLFFQ
ncbi:MAG: DUF4433 domain-containing protein [bacterium]